MITEKVNYEDVPFGEQALFPDNGGFTAIDNRDGEAFVEWFPRKEQAIAYLKGDRCGDYYRDKAIIVPIRVKRGIGKDADEIIIVLKGEKKQ